MTATGGFVKLTLRCNRSLTITGETALMARARKSDSLSDIRQQLGERIANLSRHAPRLSPLDIHTQMDAIRQVAAINGLAALECLAHRSAQLALLPGHRVSVQCCLEHMDEALSTDRSADTNAILAALAIRLH
ncbi:MAG TPA: hypothetical protein VFZ51_06270 [Woeseiaceae bacterium]